MFNKFDHIFLYYRYKLCFTTFIHEYKIMEHKTENIPSSEYFCSFSLEFYFIFGEFEGKENWNIMDYGIKCKR